MGCLNHQSAFSKLKATKQDLSNTSFTEDMKTKKEIHHQLLSYEKTYQETKNFEEFKANIYHTILDIESITPISPSYSSYLFDMKLDCENMDRFNAETIVLSLRNFLQKLE